MPLRTENEKMSAGESYNCLDPDLVGENPEMSGRPLDGFRTTELDLGLLSTPFRVQTNWHVRTGAVSSGITTLIDQLADRGFQTVPEATRLYIEEEMAKGR
jgi:hypothetical protein